ncbi:MAG: phosphatase PAP2 family protein [Devosia sp.]
MKLITARNIALLLLAALLTGLGLIIDEVAEGDTLKFDQAFLLALREPGDPTNPIGPDWLTEVARDITALGGVAVLTLLTTLVTVQFILRGKPRSALYVALAAISGTLISNTLKSIFNRPRPELTAIAEYGKGSFPSGHSTMAAVVYLTLGVILAVGARNVRLKVFYIGTALLLIVLVGLSRLYLGVHYPTDVLAGWAIGASWAVLWAIIASWLTDRHHMENPGGPLAAGVAVKALHPRNVSFTTRDPAQ